MDRTIAFTAHRSGNGTSPRRGLAQFRLWLDLWCERRTLRSLDARLLKDIGVDPEAAEREATRRPWDVPIARRGEI